MNAKRAKAMIEIGANSAAMDRGLSEARKKLRGFASGAKKTIGGTMGIGGKLAGPLGAGMGMSLGMGVIDQIASAGKEVVDFEKSLTRFQIAANKDAQTMGRLRASIAAVSSETGLARASILNGAQAYVDLTGDVEGAETAMRSFARIAQATGAEMSEIATATAAMKESGLAASEIEAVWSGLVVQGKAGAVSAKDLAGTLSTILPMMSQFAGGKGIDGIRDLGAALQVVRKGSGSAAEASTKLQSLVGTIGKSAPKLRKIGIEVFNIDKKTKTRSLKSFRDIVGQIADKKLDLEQVGKVLGTDKESLQALRMLSDQIRLWDDLKTAALDTGAIQRDLSTYQESSAAKLEKSFNEMKIAIAEAFTPERIAKFAEIMERVAKAAGWILDAVSGLAAGIDVDTGGGDALSKSSNQQLEEKHAKLIANKRMPAIARELQGASAGSFEQKAKQLLAEREALVAKHGAAKVAGKSGDLDTLEVAATYQALQDMANQLRDQATGMQSAFNKFSRELIARVALSKLPFVVKMDSSTVAKEQSNAVVNRGPKGRI